MTFERLINGAFVVLLLLLIGLGLVLRVRWQRTYQRRYLESVRHLFGDRLRTAGLSLSFPDAVLRGQLSGRGLAISLNYLDGTWQLACAVDCAARIFFLLNERDGPESYAIQVRDPGARTAISQLIQAHHLGTVPPSVHGARARRMTRPVRRVRAGGEPPPARG